MVQLLTPEGSDSSDMSSIRKIIISFENNTTNVLGSDKLLDDLEHALVGKTVNNFFISNIKSAGITLSADHRFKVFLSSEDNNLYVEVYRQYYHNTVLISKTLVVETNTQCSLSSNYPVMIIQDYINKNLGKK